jgi:hypothetical protein
MIMPYGRGIALTEKDCYNKGDMSRRIFKRMFNKDV